MLPAPISRKRRIAAILAVSLFAFTSIVPPVSAQGRGSDGNDNRTTETPIKHVIVLIGENRTFDHLFATYVPRSSDAVANLLSKKIINADGTPGKNFSQAAQFEAIPPFRTKYFASLDKHEKAPYRTLPAPTLNFAPNVTIFPPGTPVGLLAAVEPSLEAGSLPLLTTGGTG